MRKCKKRGFWWFLLMVPLGLAAFVLVLAAFGYGFMHLWNWLVPDIFNGPVISFWQGVGILVLAKILIGHHGNWKHKKHCKEYRNSCCQCCKGRCDNGGNDFCDDSEKNQQDKNWNYEWKYDKNTMKKEWKDKIRRWIDEDDKREEGGKDVQY
jgi:hypothetical protein